MIRMMLMTGFLFLMTAANSQVEKYTAPAGISDLHTVYVYQKSNWDGSHDSQVYLYVADSNQLQSYKWAEGDEVATLVTATIGWKTFSVTQFTNHRYAKGKGPQLMARLWAGGGKQINIEVGPMKDSMILTELPWQSYDFDFAGLGFVWRALKNKKDSFHFHIADAAMVEGNVKFVNKGRADVKYKGVVMLDGQKCLLYDINGAGLENKGGQIWVNASTYMIEQYKIELPDEPGFVNGMLKLLRTEKMSSEEWERFKKGAVGN